MTWPEVVAAHLNHRTTIRALDIIECVQCGMKLVIPLRADLAPTKVPPKWHIDRSEAASPETIARRKREAEAALRLIAQKRREATVEAEPDGAA